MRKCRFLARALHLDQRAVFRRDEIQIDGRCFVFLVIQIEQRNLVDHTHTDRRDEFLDRRFCDFFLVHQSLAGQRDEPHSRR